MRRDAFSIGIAFCLILFAALFRLLPHTPNFVPIAAVAIFGGTILPRRWAVTVPLVAIIATDFIVGLHDLMLVTWGSYALIALVSNVWLSKKLSFVRVTSLALASSLFFFIVTNFAVWLTSGMYPSTLTGLVECYTLALPFLRNTVMSDLVYTAGLFGVYALVVRSSLLFIEVRANST